MSYGRSVSTIVALGLLAASVSAEPRNVQLKNQGIATPRAPTLSYTELVPLTWRDLAAPSPLTAEEEESPALLAVARRHNPAMAMPTKDIWPVELRYAWHDGAPLMARVVAQDGRIVREYEGLSAERLANNEWDGLPERDDDGNRVEYHVDAPGDDRVEGDLSGWRNRFREIAGPDPSANREGYQPTQYVHAFWFNREKGLLAIQYWFYYPYNEWINHHEGDWEHINVIVRGPSRLTDKATFRPVGYQFFFHLFTHEPTQVVRIRGQDTGDGGRGDHVVVYAGGHSRFLLWSGSTSGGSYPLPAQFPGAGGGVGSLRPADDTTRPARFIRPEEFKLVMLPEPDRITPERHKDLGWVRLSFRAGQPRMYRNPLALNGLSFGGAPQQPARQGSWNAEWNPPYWNEEPVFQAKALRLPRGWQALMDPPARAAEAALARRVRPARTLLPTAIALP